MITYRFKPVNVNEKVHFYFLFCSFSVGHRPHFGNHCI